MEREGFPINRRTKHIIAYILALALILCAFPVFIFADDEEDEDYYTQMEQLNKEKTSASEKRKAAQSKVESLKSEQAAIIEEKMALEERNEAALKEIELIKSQIELIEKEIYETEKKIEIKAQEVEDAKNREDEQLMKYRTRIRAMEENSSYNILSFILESDSVSSLLASLDDYGEIMNSDKILYNNLVDAREEHERLEEEYIEYKDACEEKKAEYENGKAELEKEQAELEEQIEESEALIEEYAEKIKEAEKEQAAMEAAESAAAAAASNFVSQYIAAKNAALSASTIAQNSGEEAAASTQSSITVYEGSTGSGSFIWPFPNHFVVTSTFGYRSSTSSYHTGVDIDGYQSAGSPIVASDSGTVIKSEYYGGYGNCIIIDHGNGYSTLYAHLNSMYVSEGQSVGQGSTIGGVGNTGTCYGLDGVHLHFEVIQNGTQVDPLAFLSGYSYTLY